MTSWSVALIGVIDTACVNVDGKPTVVVDADGDVTVAPEAPAPRSDHAYVGPLSAEPTQLKEGVVAVPVVGAHINDVPPPITPAGFKNTVTTFELTTEQPAGLVSVTEIVRVCDAEGEMSAEGTVIVAWSFAVTFVETTMLPVKAPPVTVQEPKVEPVTVDATL